MKKSILIFIGLTIALFSYPPFIKSRYFAFLIFGPDGYRLIRAVDESVDLCWEKLGPKHTDAQFTKCYDDNFEQVKRSIAGGK